MANFGFRILRFSWLLIVLALAIWGLAGTVHKAHRPGWFWLFLAMVVVAVGVIREWYALWKRAGDEKSELRAIGRRLRVELTTMGHDLDRVEAWEVYDGFVGLPAATWTTEGERLAHLPEVFDPVAAAYVSADAFNKHISTRQAVTKAESLEVTPDDGLDALRVEIEKAKDALDLL